MHGVIDRIASNDSIEATFVVPVTDDGGSSLQIVQTFGGPAVGDIRNVALRIAVAQHSCSPELTDFMYHRLTLSSNAAAEKELWDCVSAIKTNRVLRQLEEGLHWMAREGKKRGMDFRNASIGNMVLYSTWILRAESGRFTEACDLFTNILNLTNCVILPSLEVFRTQDAMQPTFSVVAKLRSGTVLTGQRQISYGEVEPNAVEVNKTIQSPMDSPIIAFDIISSSALIPCEGLTHDALMILGRGSTVTSILSAAWPHKSLLTSSSKVCLIENGVCDRESSASRCRVEVLVKMLALTTFTHISLDCEFHYGADCRVGGENGRYDDDVLFAFLLKLFT